MRQIIFFTTALMCVSTIVFAQADSLENRLRQQLQSTVSQLRDLQASQATLQAAKDVAEKERDTLKIKVGKAGTDSSVVLTMKKEIARLRDENTNFVASLAAAKNEASKATSEATSATAEAKRQSQQEVDRLKNESTSAVATLNDTKAAVAACIIKNQSLIKVSHEILERYQHPGLGSIWRHDPFVGLKRVQLENAAQGYADKIDDGSVNTKIDKAQ